MKILRRVVLEAQTQQSAEIGKRYAGLIAKANSQADRASDQFRGGPRSRFHKDRVQRLRDRASDQATQMGARAPGKLRAAGLDLSNTAYPLTAGRVSLYENKPNYYSAEAVAARGRAAADPNSEENARITAARAELDSKKARAIRKIRAAGRRASQPR